MWYCVYIYIYLYKYMVLGIPKIRNTSFCFYQLYISPPSKSWILPGRSNPMFKQYGCMVVSLLFFGIISLASWERTQETAQRNVAQHFHVPLTSSHFSTHFWTPWLPSTPPIRGWYLTKMLAWCKWMQKCGWIPHYYTLHTHHPAGIFHFQQIWLFWWCETNPQKGSKRDINPNP